MNTKALVAVLVMGAGFSGNLLVAQSVYPGDHTTLDIMYRGLAGDYDYFSSNSQDEILGNTSEGQVFYVPSTALANTTELYRLHSEELQLHMDSYDPSEGGSSGYSAEGDVGYPWNGSYFPGLSLIERSWNSTNGSHITKSPDENIPGYSSEYFGLYGYKRFLLSGEQDSSITNGTVTVTSNLVAGGSVWGLTWNGRQLINHSDYGREMQSAFFTAPGAPTPGNPTEAGGANYAIVNEPDHPEFAHGSPLVSASKSPDGLSQSTRCVPLEFNPDYFGGDQYDHPVIWYQMELGKDISLNADGMANVIHYQTYLNTPNALPAGTDIEIPTGYVAPDLDQFYVYDCTASTKENHIASPGQSGIQIDGSSIAVPPYGGVILATSDGSYAMGVYGVTIGNGGSIDHFALFDFSDLPSGQCTKWSSSYTVPTAQTLPAGATSFSTYVIVGTLADVEGSMDQLYTDRAFIK